MYTAIKDMNYVKLTFDDLPLFDAIVMDILPGISIPEIQYEELEAAIRRQLKVLQLQPITNIITKIIQLYEMKLSRHSVIVLGETCTAKSVTWKVLQAAYNDLKSKGNPKFVNCEVFPLNPKSMTLGELYGEYNFATGEWKDGVLSYIMRTICASKSLQRPPRIRESNNFWFQRRLPTRSGCSLTGPSMRFGLKI
jgi:dynein heavy chain, axonemal